MSNVTLEIAGRKYTIACAEGEEPHIEMLGQSIDEKLSALENLHGQSPERILLYAALLLADELHEAKTDAPPPAPSQLDEQTADTLEAMANHLESVAMQLETGAVAH